MLRRYFGKISPLPIETFIGKDGELVIDDGTGRVYVMDGITPGGTELGSNIGVNLGALTVNSQTISGTVVNGNININPNGSGNLVVAGNLYIGTGDFKIRRRVNNDENTVVLASDTSSVTLRSANTFNYLHFDTVTGNIGINTELPAYRFDIHGPTRITQSLNVDRIYANTVFAAGSSPTDGQGIHFGTVTDELGSIKYVLGEGKLKLISHGNVALEIVPEGRVIFPKGIQSNFNPAFNNLYTLGNVSHHWKELWISSNLIINGNYISVSNGSLTVNGNAVNTSGVVVSNTAPTLIPGAQWFNSEEGRLYVNYNSTWVEASPTQIDPSAIRADINGNVELPSGLTFASLSNFAPAYGTVIQQNPGEIINLFTTAEGGGTSIGWIENPSAAGNIAAISFNQWPRTVSIDTGNFNDTVYSWRFDQQGNLNLPAGGSICENGGLSGTALSFTPAGTSDPDQRLLVYPTIGEGNHIHLTSGNLAVTSIFLGDDSQYIRTQMGNIVIATNDSIPDLEGYGYRWIFDTTGNLTLPAGGNISYSPVTPSDWDGSPPTTIEQAIDRLAALVKTLNSGTGA